MTFFKSLMLCGAAAASASLSPGDCAFVAVFADEPSQFGLLMLKDTAGEKIFVTDSLGEDGTLPQANIREFASAVSAGTVLRQSSFKKAAGTEISGDKLIAFTGSWSAPQPICSVHMSEKAEKGRLLSGLEEGASTVALGEVDNAYYNGPSVGTVEELRGAIHDPSLWSVENARPEDRRILSFTISSGSNTTMSETMTTTFGNSTMMTTTATTTFETTTPMETTTMAPTTTMVPTTTTMAPTTTTAAVGESNSGFRMASAGLAGLLLAVALSA